MDKKQQIEEMAKIYCKNEFLCSKGCQTNGCRVYEVSEALYNAGYRKIDNGYAVITKAEFKQYKVQAVKEFAETLKKKLYDFFQDNEELDGKISVGPLYVDIIGVEATDGAIISLGLIDRLLKEYEK